MKTFVRLCLFIVVVSSLPSLAVAAGQTAGQAALRDGDALFHSQKYGEAFSKYLDAKIAGSPAEQGIAELKIGMMYIHGNGFTVDRDQGMRWLNMAAAQGNIDARNELEKLSAPPPVQQTAQTVQQPAAQQAPDLPQADEVSGYNHCVSHYYEGTLKFHNDCKTPILVIYVGHHATSFSGLPGSMEIEAGENGWTSGVTPKSIEDAGGISIYVCPSSYLPIDSKGKTINGRLVASFTCKKKTVIDALRQQQEQQQFAARQQQQATAQSAIDAQKTALYQHALEAARTVTHQNPLQAEDLGKLDVATLQRRADAGEAAAQNSLGTRYWSGRGVSQDRAQALVWYRKAADQGFAAAQGNMGAIYENGWGVQKDYPLALFWYRKAADQGSALAQYDVGTMYQNGSGVPQDYIQALIWYRKAADQGLAVAQGNMGVIYQNGWGVPQDYAQAMFWFRKAADLGLAVAQNYVGFFYQNGWGVPQDYAQALFWYRKSADQGNAAAQNNVGAIYQNGWGVPQDHGQALVWYHKAADQGLAVAKTQLAMFDAPPPVISQSQPVQQQASQQQAAQQQAAQDDSDRQEKISELQSDIEMQEQSAQDDERSANQVLNNCSGPGYAICQAIGQAGAARFRQNAARAKNKADEDREEIQRLEGEQVQARQRRDTSYGGSLQRVATESGTSIQNAAAQQQANYQAMIAAQQRQQAEAQARQQAEAQARQQAEAQARQQAEAQARQQAEARARAAAQTPRPVQTNTTAAPRSAPTTSATNNGYNPYSSTPAPGSFNPYTGTGTGSIQAKCTDVTGSVSSRVTWHGPVGAFCPKEMDVFFTNHSAAPVSCTWAYLKDGVWHNYGGATIRPGATVGGEDGGDWTCNPDNGQIRYMCFPKAENDTKACSNQLPSDWK